jgi:hypothetical protein
MLVSLLNNIHIKNTNPILVHFCSSKNTVFQAELTWLKASVTDNNELSDLTDMLVSLLKNIHTLKNLYYYNPFSVH